MSLKDELQQEMIARSRERNKVRASGLIDDDMSLDVELPGEGGVYIDINLIDPSPHQLRRVFPAEHIENLAESIRNEGLNQPLVVVMRKERYELISGENRLRACKTLKMDRVLCVVRNINDSAAAKSVVGDNLLHNDISDYETYLGLLVLDKAGAISGGEKARIIGKDRKHIWRLEKFGDLPPEVLTMLDEKPSLFGCNCAEVLAGYTQKGHGALVVQAVDLIAKNKLKQMSVGVWIEDKLEVKQKIRIKEPLKLNDGKEIGSISIKNNKIEIQITDTNDASLIERIKATFLESMTNLPQELK